MKVVIMAGGKGTRIASVKNDVPKPMMKSVFLIFRPRIGDTAV